MPPVNECLLSCLCVSLCVCVCVCVCLCMCVCVKESGSHGETDTPTVSPPYWSNRKVLILPPRERGGGPQNPKRKPSNYMPAGPHPIQHPSNHLVCRLLLDNNNNNYTHASPITRCCA